MDRRKISYSNDGNEKVQRKIATNENNEEKKQKRGLFAFAQKPVFTVIDIRKMRGTMTNVAQIHSSHRQHTYSTKMKQKTILHFTLIFAVYSLKMASTSNALQQNHKEGAVRHAEKRRIATCRFADRVAAVSIEAFKQRVPQKWRDENKQVCLATFVVHHEQTDGQEGRLYVISLGVGTKYLSQETLRKECGDASAFEYGKRIRDSHAEVLARRALRKKILIEIKKCMTGSSSELLQAMETKNGKQVFQLKQGVTIHMYTSSTPCGNSSLKKFATFSKEKFNDDLGKDEWPTNIHEAIPAHSLHLGQLALLVKKDISANEKCGAIDEAKFAHLPKKQRKWPANISDEWCPPNTAPPRIGKGSIHSCSDKICRWNYLGLQGSLLSSLLDGPLYMNSITIGRKFSRVTAQRAVCCHLANELSLKWN